MTSPIKALIVGIAAVSTSTAQAETSTSPKAVIELFTSQGCSSCPPADVLLQKLGQDPSVITLSMPVDYWDYLGWKDTYAKPTFSQRQRAYGGVRGDRQVYTPQAVINGQAHANGTSRSEIAAAVGETAPPMSVPVALAKSAAGFDVVIGEASAKSLAKGAVVLALSVIGEREVAIGRGENAKRKVTYTNIVREVKELAPYGGQAARLTVPASLADGADSLVVLIQAGTLTSPGAILGAQRIALR